MTKVLLKHDVNTRQVAAIRSNGDSVFFGGNKTAEMKKKLGVPDKRALADFLPLVIMTARSTASGITALNTEVNNLNGFGLINKEHVKNNSSMRKLLAESNVIPENEPAAADIEHLRIKYGLSRGPRKLISPDQMPLL
jgi:DNA-damage-inducible protein D